MIFKRGSHLDTRKLNFEYKDWLYSSKMGHEGRPYLKPFSI